MIELTSEDTSLVASIATSFPRCCIVQRLLTVCLTLSESSQMPAYQKPSQKVPAGRFDRTDRGAPDGAQVVFREMWLVMLSAPGDLECW
jgi:hypothetical protein